MPIVTKEPGSDQGDYARLLEQARAVRQRMREQATVLGLSFPREVRLQVAFNAVEDGLKSGRLLDVAVGYLLIRECLEEAPMREPRPTKEN